MRILSLFWILFSFSAVADSFSPGRNPLFYSDEDARRDLHAFCRKETPEPKAKNIFSEKALKTIVADEQSMGISLRCIDELIARLRTLEPTDCGTKRSCLQAKEAFATYLTALSASREKKKNHFADQIVYSNPYQRTSTPEDFQKALNSEDGSCESYVISGNQALLASNMDTIKGLSRICRSSILMETAYGFTSQREWVKNYESSCREFPVDKCLKLAADLELYRSNLRELTSSVGRSLNLSESDIACLPSPETSEPNTLSEMLNKARNVVLCEPLAPGKAHVVDTREGNPTGVSPRYMIKQEEDGSYTVNLRMKFSSPAGVDVPTMEKRIRDCYKEIEPFMRGPSGEQMRLHLLSDEEYQSLAIDQRPPSNPVYVTSEDGRANSQFYPANVGCSTIVHEGLHLLGLVDEYDGTTDGYTCRVSPKASSIMSNSYDHYPASLDQVKTCSCAEEFHCQEIFKGDDENLKNFFARANSSPNVPESIGANCDIDYEKTETFTLDQVRSMAGKLPFLSESETELVFVGYYFPKDNETYKMYPHKCTCPTGENCAEAFSRYRAILTTAYETRRINGCQSSSETHTEKITASPDKKWSLDGTTLTFYLRAKETLLAPTQFKRIITGNCPTSTPEYDQCAVWAYRAKDNTGACPGRPESCSSDFNYIGIPQ